MGAKERPWQVQVDVYLESDDDPDKPVFRIESSLPSHRLETGEKCLVFENNHRPGFTILFHLHDQTTSGYRFPPDADDAVRSRIGDKCPDDQWTKNEVFRPLRVIDSGETLVVYNENGKRDGEPIDRFWYALRVFKDGNSKPLLLDPPGDNTNGQQS